MSYTALYRKFRPSTFDEVKGQDHIVTTLKNQIKNDRIGHAYLFCGTRGTGKTSVAKIFAKAVNCEHPQDGNPCGTCSVCRAVAEGRSMNVIEIDAASNNGVDNIREIREEVEYSPTEGRFKVYIIDEVHMLSIGAFNALLKTLEEPPAYVIFILATTEAHKIPITIMSRCQRYDFRRISIDTITARLSELMKAEGISAEEKALRYVAKAGDGSMRDSLSLLDQCLAFYMGSDLKYENVLEVLGAVDTDVFSSFYRKIVEGDSMGLICELEKIIIEGRELSQFVTDFVWYLRNLMLMKSAPDPNQILEMSEENLKILAEDCVMCDMNALMRYIRVFSELSGQIKNSTQKRVLTEVALIKLTRPEMETGLDSVLDRIRNIERKLESTSFVSPAVQDSAKASGAASVAMPKGPTEEVKALIKARSEDVIAVKNNWRNILSDFQYSLRPVLSNHMRLGNGGGNKLQLIFWEPTFYDTVVRPENIDAIKTAIADKLGCDMDIEPVLVSDDVNVDDNYDTMEDLVRIEIQEEE